MGKSADSAKAITVYLEPLDAIAVEELAHGDRMRVSEWCRNVIAAAVRKRQEAVQVARGKQAELPGMSSGKRVRKRT